MNLSPRVRRAKSPAKIRAVLWHLGVTHVFLLMVEGNPVMKSRLSASPVISRHEVGAAFVSLAIVQREPVDPPTEKTH